MALIIIFNSEIKKLNNDNQPNEIEAAIPPWGKALCGGRRGLGGCRI